MFKKGFLRNWITRVNPSDATSDEQGPADKSVLYDKPGAHDKMPRSGAHDPRPPASEVTTTSGPSISDGPESSESEVGQIGEGNGGLPSEYPETVTEPGKETTARTGTETPSEDNVRLPTYEGLEAPDSGRSGFSGVSKDVTVSNEHDKGAPRATTSSKWAGGALVGNGVAWVKSHQIYVVTVLAALIVIIVLGLWIAGIGPFARYPTTFSAEPESYMPSEVAGIDVQEQEPFGSAIADSYLDMAGFPGLTAVSAASEGAVPDIVVIAFGGPRNSVVALEERIVDDYGRIWLKEPPPGNVPVSEVMDLETGSGKIEGRDAQWVYAAPRNRTTAAAAVVSVPTDGVLTVAISNTGDLSEAQAALADVIKTGGE